MRRTRAARAAAVLLAVQAFAAVLTAPRAAADVVHLKNGNQIQGEIVRRGDASITVRFPGGFLEIDRDDIETIEAESRLEYLLAEGEKHLARRDYDGAVDFLRSARSEFPDSTRASRRLLAAREEQARQLLESRRLAKARRTFQAILELDPRHATALTGLEIIADEFARAEQESRAAISELEEGRIDRAHRRLRGLYEEFPDQRATLARSLALAVVQLGNRALTKRELETAEAHYREALSLDPDQLPRVAPPFVALKVAQLRPLFELNQYERLLEATDEALTVVPTSPELLYFRGHALEGLGRYEDAALSYLRITGGPRPSRLREELSRLKSDAERLFLGRAREEQPADEVLAGDFRTLKTEHFVVHHRNHRIGRAVAEAAEATYERLFAQLGLRAHWLKPCAIWIFPDKEEFTKVRGSHQWMGGSHSFSGRGALAEHRIDTYQTQPRLVQTVIPHEVAHALLTHRLRNRPTIPIWIQEGFALSVEPSFVHRYYDRLVSQAFELDTLIDVEDVLRTKDYPDGDDVGIFYGQCFSLCRALIRQRGLDRFIQFAEELTLSPQSLSLLLQRHYKLKGPAGLEHAWRGALHARRASSRR